MSSSSSSPAVDVNGCQVVEHIPEINISEIRWWILANRPAHDPAGGKILWPNMRLKLWKDRRGKAKEYTVHGAGVRIPPPEYILIDNRDAKPGFYGPVVRDLTDREISVPWQWDAEFRPIGGMAFLNYGNLKAWAREPGIRRECGLPPWRREEDEWLNDESNFLFDDEGVSIYGLHIHCLPDTRLMIKRDIEKILGEVYQRLDDYALFGGAPP